MSTAHVESCLHDGHCWKQGLFFLLSNMPLMAIVGTCSIKLSKYYLESLYVWGW